MTIVKAHIEHGPSKPQIPKLIVMHSMSEFIGDQHAAAWFANLKSPNRKSVHSLVDTEGTNYRLREDTEGAWHAKGFNTDSLGIEAFVEGQNTYGEFLKKIKVKFTSEKQYQEIKRQIIEWINVWPIREIKRHSDLSPGRKHDPGDGFPYQQMLQEIGGL